MLSKRFIVFALLLGSFASVGVAKEVRVGLEPLSDLLFYPEHSVPAEVISRQDSAISAELTARIDQILVDVGDRVAEGDLLVRLNCDLSEAQLSAQKSVLSEISVQARLAKDQLDRAVRLNRSGNLGEDALQQRQTELSVLNARASVQREQIALAQLTVDRCDIKAPFGGVISERSAQLGSLASPGTPLVRLVQLIEAQLSAQVPESLSIAQATDFRFESAGNAYPVIFAVDLPVINTRQRTREVRFDFADDLPAIGASGRLVWSATEPQIAPERLVRRKLGEQWMLGVLWDNQGVAEFTPIPDAKEGQPATISLPLDTRLITKGLMQVQPGDTLVESEASN